MIHLLKYGNSYSFSFCDYFMIKIRGNLHAVVAICFPMAHLISQIVENFPQIIRKVRILCILRSGTYQLIDTNLTKIISQLLSDFEAMKHECLLRLLPDHICTGCKYNLGSECK